MTDREILHIGTSYFVWYNTMETVQLYMSGILSADEAVERLRYSKVNNQVSFHTKEALKHLHFEERQEV